MTTSPIATEFNLAEIVRDVVDNSEAADPKVLAEEVLEYIEPEHYIDALRKTLPNYVRLFAIRPNRTSKPAPPVFPVPDHKGTDNQNPPVGNGGMPVNDNTSEKGQRPPHASPRWQDVGRWWAKQTVFVGEWKHLPELTKDECFAAAKIRFDNSASNLVEAKRYQRLGEELGARPECKFVANLPLNLVDEIWS